MARQLTMMSAWFAAMLVLAACQGHFPPPEDTGVDGDLDHPDADADRDADTIADADADSDSDADTDADSEADMDPDAESDSGADAGADADADDCLPHATSGCFEGDLWWVDSCDHFEDIRENCDDGLTCSADECFEEAGECRHRPNCSDLECVAAFPECQCHPLMPPLTCGASTAGSLAPGGRSVTDVLEHYGRGCNLDSATWPAGPLDGHELTFRFSQTIARTQVVTVTLSSVCGDELWAVALDGFFEPCDPSRCATGQTRSAPV